MLSFIESSLMIMCSGSPFSCSLVFPTGLDTGCSISLPLLKVIMAWTSSIFGAGSLRSLVHVLPLDWAVFGKGTSLSPALATDYSGYRWITAMCQFSDLGFYEALQSFCL